jgi:N6-adenosine-specific RNA methylase IME4/ParB-like chromosome segregation protein Spo0J
MTTEPDPTRMSIDAIKVGVRVRKDMGDIDALALSINELGLLQPIGVRPDGTLVCGERRLRAVGKLGWKEIPVHVCQNLEDAVLLLKAEGDENVCRKEMVVEERLALGEKIEVLMQPEQEAKEKAGKSADGWGGGRGNKKPCGKLPQGLPDSRKTRTHAAVGAGMKPRTYDKARKVRDAAKQEPEKYGKLLDQMNASGKVDGAYRALQKARAAEEIAAEPPPLPEGAFRVIVVDPPWAYGKRAGDLTQRGATPYPSMSLDELKALPVGKLAHPDAVLWLWTTNAHMRDAFELLDASGFTHKTILTWVKPRLGTGDWLRGRTEHCLMAVRGRPAVTLTNQATAIEGPLREHSRKPEEFYALVESLCPGSRVELFCRTERKGWASHGTKLDRFKHGETT